MVIELFGCTSAGKSSLARRLRVAAGARMGDDFVLARAGLGWLPGRLPRLLALDVLALAACLGALRRRREFLRYAWSCVRGLPAELSLGRRLNIARNVFKKAGIREILGRAAPPETLLLMDEGALQSAHYLFVQPCAEPDVERLGGFLERVPLPDVAVHVCEEQGTLVRRTLARGHPRVPEGTREATERFLARAAVVFAAIAAEPRVRERLVIVDAPTGTARAATSPASGDVEQALAEIRSGVARDEGPGTLLAEASAG